MNDIMASRALRYLAENPRPAGGQSHYNSEHLYQLADEVDELHAQTVRLNTLVEQRVSVELLQTERATADRLREDNAKLRSQVERKKANDEMLAFFLAFFESWPPGSQLTLTNMEALERARAKVAAFPSEDSRG